MGYDIQNLLSRINLNTCILAALVRTVNRFDRFDAERISRTLCKPLDSKRKRGAIFGDRNFSPPSTLIPLIWLGC